MNTAELAAIYKTGKQDAVEALNALDAEDAERALGPLRERPTNATDPSECAWCFAEACGEGPQCPYHGERAQAEP
jgi:hypothetical protein